MKYSEKLQQYEELQSELNGKIHEICKCLNKANSARFDLLSSPDRFESLKHEVWVQSSDYGDQASMTFPISYLDMSDEELNEVYAKVEKEKEAMINKEKSIQKQADLKKDLAEYERLKNMFE